jgi:hypothetical protein
MLHGEPVDASRKARAAMTRVATAVPFALLALWVAASTLRAQEAAPSAALSADSVAMAEVFDYAVRVPVPAGSIVYFPDSVPATPDVESFAPVRWDAERAEGGGATLVLTYPLIPFREGFVTIPAPDVFVVPREDGDEGERLPGGSLVGAWSDAPRALRFATDIPSQRVWVRYVYTSQDIVDGLAPQPPRDVMGFSWSWPSIALVLLFSSVIGGAVTTTTRGWLATRQAPARPTSAGPPSLADARLHALSQLDRLLANVVAGERVLELYTESSGIIRGFVERLRPDLGLDLTATESMERLEAASEGSPDLFAEMRQAERVKFGRLRPDRDAAEHHLRTVRTWVEDSEATPS